ncbi:MAG: hypothetical protein VXZ39_07075, partial [Planctomycetota bacterium]|nr:hypothetical protein [Planctomycetota bacterium]
MGVIDWFKRGVQEMMVARPDGTKAQIVWKHPDETIPMKSQLTVDSDEVAVFFKDGKVVETGRASKIMTFQGLERVPTDEAKAGDIISLAGLT